MPYWQLPACPPHALQPVRPHVCPRPPTGRSIAHPPTRPPACPHARTHARTPHPPLVQLMGVLALRNKEEAFSVRNEAGTSCFLMLFLYAVQITFFLVLSKGGTEVACTHLHLARARMRAPLCVHVHAACAQASLRAGVGLPAGQTIVHIHLVRADSF